MTAQIRLAILALLLLGLVGTHWRAYVSGKATVQRAWDEQSLSVAQQSLKLSEQATRVTVDLQAQADKLRTTKNAQISKLDADLADALERLRERPSRPSPGSLPQDSTAGGGCYPASLWSEDAGVALKLGAEADRLRAGLQQCQTAYDAARDALK